MPPDPQPPQAGPFLAFLIILVPAFLFLAFLTFLWLVTTGMCD